MSHQERGGYAKDVTSVVSMADIIPHLIYGGVTTLVYHVLTAPEE